MTNKITLKISGMHCVSCAMCIDGDLEDNIKGVKSACTNYAKQICEVEITNESVKTEHIINQIKKSGYTAELA